MMKKQLILCSTSKRRQELMELLNMPYVIYPVKIDENIKVKTPVELVTKLALMKALEGAKKFSSGICLGADTVVVSSKDKILGKPKNISEAIKILKTLSGTWHKVYTGIAVINCQESTTFVDYEYTEVKMKNLDDDEIEFFAKKHLDKAGAYAVQEKNDKIIEKIHGDYYNVVGLPIKRVSKLLRKFRI